MSVKIEVEVVAAGVEKSDRCVVALIMGERVPLNTFSWHEDERLESFKQGAELLAKALESYQPSPEKVAQMAQEAARAAGVDESTIAQGGVAVGPWGAVSVPGDDGADDHYLHEDPIFE